MTGALEGRVIVVTGAAGGIGRGILRMCIAAGARVAGLDIAGNATARIEAEGGLPYQTDVADAEKLASAIRRVRQDLGRLDGLVSNAGVTLIAPFLDADLAMWERLWQVNQRSVLVGAQTAARIMVADDRAGSIVNIASNHALASDAGYEAYAGTKGAVTAMTKAMAWSLGRHGIRVNTLCPGLTMTEAVTAAASDPERAALFNAWHATSRVNMVDEVGRAAVFLLSDAASAISGAEIVADQGMSARLGDLGGEA
jgi:NAD(P)-dependent dehydrogenase (short-subunit alcohol dehydrogenase family)